MPHDIDLILTLTGGLGAALVFGFITQRLKLSPLVGYLLAGVVVGPFTPGFVADGAIAEQLSEMGVILLMFGVGMHFDIDELLAVRKVAIPGAIAQIAVATALGAFVTHMFGWSLTAGIVFGLAISVASTVVLLRVLGDNDALHTRTGHVAVGWLIVEDIFTVLVLVLMPMVVVHDATRSSTDVALSILVALLKVAALIAFTFIVGRRVIPALLGYVAQTRSRELFTLTVLVIALGISVGAAKLFGASMALGAFLAGMVVGQSDFSTRAASEAMPMRDAFAVLFFVSMGMLLNPHTLLANLPLASATLAVVLIGKPLAAFIVVRVLGYPLKMAFSVSIALAQIGEFSFIVAALGRALDVLPAAATQALVISAIVSITLNPFLFRLVEPLSKYFGKPAASGLDPTQPALPDLDAFEHRAIIVGCGPVGRTLVDLLKDSHIEPVVIELNHETVAELRARGVHAIYGDASQHEVLEQAGIASATSLVFAASAASDAVIRAARSMQPKILIISRATYLSETKQLRGAGADIVVPAEGEVALAVTQHVLSALGATHEQLDRARDRVRSELASAS